MGTNAGTITLPLTPDARAAYEELYNTCQAAIEATADLDLLQRLNDASLAIGGVISADNAYRLNQDTAAFQALLTQVNSANAGLKTLQTQIAGIASTIGLVGQVAGGITKLLSFFPGI